MATQICNNLIHEPWMFYSHASEVLVHVGGIYVIGIKRPKLRAVKYLYLGQSKDVHKRLQAHKYGSQDIDAFIKQNYRRNGGKDLRAKWINEPRHKSKEGGYIRCMEHLLGYELKYNKNGRNK